MPNKILKLMKNFFFYFVIILGCTFPRTNETVKNDEYESLNDENNIWSPLIQNTDNFLVVRGTINNTECNIMIDTGGNEMGIIKMDSAFFYSTMDTTGLILNKNIGNRSIMSIVYSGEIQVKISGIIFSAREIDIRKQRFSYFREGDNYVAVIGKLFYDKIMAVDFDEQKLAFADSLVFDTLNYTKTSMHPPKIITSIQDKGNKVDNQNEKYIEVCGFIDKKGKKIAGRFLFDTGSIKPLILKSDIGKKLKTPEVYEKFADPFENKEALWVWRADTLNIGDINFSNVEINQALFGMAPGYPFLDLLEGGDGLMGMELIKRFNFIADFKNNVLYLKQNNH